MLKIRLRRMGAIRQPHYRIVVADSRSPRDGRFIEILGHYNPRTEPATIQVDVAKYDEWKSKGAQPTGAVDRLVRQFNRTARKADAAATAEAAGTPATPDRRTRSASGKRMTTAPAAAAPATASEEAVTSEEETAEPVQEVTAETPAQEAATEAPAEAEESETDKDTAS